ncbi:ABC transporter substrate-binding protein [Phytoactinopolyspora mesophila]|uniref:ABC transporter substrate-binding protein n=1 Tax=Phytoactinopolyspora mesophila TaxID=2650750 RepID=A0A7K3M023_9ACTN|nr:ABC transporter substrate-binding protein [Phytoactinopolyspora mesophila]NDL55808.1 ABC transporter substrate-binding protein [Phytoactinopolyspora mesophila]
MRNLRARAVGAGFAGVVVALGACSSGNPGTQADTDAGTAGDPVTGGDLVVASLPTVIDPAASTSRTNWMVAATVCEGLFANGADQQVHDGLVAAWEYDTDELVYRMALRDDVVFHNGDPLTADDAVASLERYGASDSGEQFGELVDGYTIDSDTEFTIELNQPSGAIPALLATPDSPAYIMPASAIDGASPDDALEELTCTGPYQLDSFTVDQNAKLSRFDGYVSRDEEPDGSAGAKTAYVDTIEFIPFNSANALNQVRTNAVHVAPQFVSLDQLDSYESDPALAPVVQVDGGFKLLQFNHEEGPFTDLRLREAVKLAVDPEAIAIQNLGGLDYFSDNSSMFAEDSPWHSPAGEDVYLDRANPESAAALLDEAGYDGTPVRMLYRPDQDAYGPLLQQQLEDAGFVVEPLAVDAATFTATRTEPDSWDLFLAGGTSYSDPLTVVFLADSFPGWWVSDRKTELMNAILEGADFDERKPAWDELQGLIWEELPFIKLGSEPRMAITSVDVGGFEPQQGTVRGFYNIWLNGS